MKIIKKNVYYCEYCSKRSLSGGHMKKHESGCTANPNRKCLVCGNEYDLPKIVAEFKTRFTIEDTATLVNIEFDIWNYEKKGKWTGEPVTLDEIQELVDGCPACTLAILRQTELNRYYFEGMIDKFNYNKKH